VKTINIQAAKTHLSRLIEEVISGEEIVLAKAGKPLVRLVPYAPTRAARVGAQLAGKIWVAPDCWAPDDDVFAASIDAPLAQPARTFYPMPSGDPAEGDITAESPASPVKA